MSTCVRQTMSSAHCPCAQTVTALGGTASTGADSHVFGQQETMSRKVDGEGDLRRVPDAVTWRSF